MGAGVYVHIPFCARKCSYCDFCTVRYDPALIDEYHRSLKREIEMYSISETVETLYFGGGSPSLYPVELLNDLLVHLNSSLRTEIREATIEVNPWELERERLLEWRKMGFSRVSVGVQSSEKSILKICKRPVPSDLTERLLMSRDIFDNLNLDFILGLPREAESNVRANLELIGAIGPDHVSYYVFDSDHETELMSQVHDAIIELPDPEILERLHDLVLESLGKMGYRRYEISSWAMNDRECLHNLKYWRNEQYLGFGLSAGGHFDWKRYVNTGDLNHYHDLIGRNIVPVSEFNQNTVIQELFETLFMGLRLTEGVDLSRKGYPKELLDLLISRIRLYLGEYLSPDNGIVALNESGMDFSRSVFQKLLDIKEEMEIAFST